MISELWVSEYCKEDPSLIENYGKAIADTTQVWECHHRAEILPCGRYSQDQLKKHGIFKHVPASQLIFLTKSEHRRLHNLGNTYWLGKHHSDEAKARMSESQRGKLLSSDTKAKIAAANKGENNPFFGKRHDEATKAKIAEAIKRHWQKRRDLKNGRV